MTGPQPMRAPARDVDMDDVDDIIGLAAEMRQADEGKLTVEELTAVAAELELPAPYVERAIAALEERRAESRAAQARRKRALRIVAVAAVAALALAMFSGVASVNALRTRAAEVEMGRAQVGNVIERREQVVVRVGAETGGRDAQAELAGADNRVAIEIRRYDQVAGGYNAMATSFPDSLWATLAGLPSRVPLSSEIEQW